MNAILKDDRITVEDYLQGELASEVKHEYIDGYVYAMSGTSKNHEKIIHNLSRKLGNHLDNMPCDVYTSNIKVYVSSSKFFYPDVMVVCGDDSEDEYCSEKPVILVEVLSKLTRRKDHTTKRFAYRQIETLQEYVLIEQDFVEIEISRRSAGWDSQHYFLGDEVYFESLDLTMPVAEIYRRVDNQEMREFLQATAQQQNTGLTT
jgi:Uma2 family endonuclease